MKNILFLFLISFTLLTVVYSQDSMIEDSNMWLEKGKQYYELKDYAKAKEALNLSLDMWGGNTKAKKLLNMMDSTKVIDTKKGKEAIGWKVKNNKSISVPDKKVIAVNNKVVIDDDVFFWLKKGDVLYSKGNLKKAVDAYKIAYEMAPNNPAVKQKLNKANLELQNRNFSKLYPQGNVVVQKKLSSIPEKPAAIKVVSTGSNLLRADPIYKEVVTEVGVPQVPVSDINLVKPEDNVFPNLRLGQLIVRVKKGMTFEQIFKKYLKNYQDMKKVAVFNKIRNIHKIKPGMIIRIPKKYLNMDYVDQYFSGSKTFVKQKIEVIPSLRPKAVQVKKQNIAYYKPTASIEEIKRLKQSEKNNNKKIEMLKNEIRSMKKLLVKSMTNKSSETHKVIKMPVPVKKSATKTGINALLEKVKNRKSQVKNMSHKKTIRMLVEKLSEKDRNKKLVEIREELKQNEKRSNKEIEMLKNEISAMKELLVKSMTNKSSETHKELKTTVSVRKTNRKSQVKNTSHKKTIQILADKLSEKERNEKLLEIRKKLKELKSKYYSKKKINSKDYKYKKEIQGYKQKIYDLTMELAKYKKETETLKNKPVVEKVVLDSIVKKYKDELQKKDKELSSRKRIILKLNQQLVKNNKQAVDYSRIKTIKSKLNTENADLKNKLNITRNQLKSLKETLKKRYNTASTDEQALTFTSNSAASHFKAAMEYWKKGLFSEAIEEYKKAVDLDSSLLLRDDKGLTEAALNYAQSTIKSRKSSMNNLHYKLAVIYQKKGLLNKSLYEYKELLSESPNDERVFFNMGLIFEQMHKYKSAVEAFEKISSLPKVSNKYLRMATNKIESLSDKLKK